MAFDPQGSVLLEELTWKEIGEALEHGWTRAVVVSGSTEQHGPHLPLITDTALGYALGERVARKWGKAFLAPVIRPACSDHHMGFPGSFTVPEEVYGQMLRAVCDSLVHHGFKALYLISSHGGNFAPIDRLAPSLAAAYADQGVRVMTGVNLDDFIQSQHQTLTALGDRPHVGRGTAERPVVVGSALPPVAIVGHPYRRVTLDRAYG
ncbi:MAG: creatininase family protein, partial [Thermaerobacterales bacterium]